MSERKEAWFRIIVAIVSGIVLKFWGIAVFIIAIVNWLIVVFSGKRDKGLADFCEYWNTEKYKYYRYLTLVSNKRPFPFSGAQRMTKFEK